MTQETNQSAVVESTENVSATSPSYPVAIDAHYAYQLTGGSVVQFVKPAADGSLEPGTTNEEVIKMLIQRITMQNAVQPDTFNTEMLLHLTGALECQRARMARLAPVAAGETKFGIFMHPCASSNLAGYGYDVPGRVLALEFKGGRIYHYRDVPQHVYDGLIEADSHGAYASAHITGKFEGARMEQPATAAA